MGRHSSRRCGSRLRRRDRCQPPRNGERVRRPDPAGAAERQLTGLDLLWIHRASRAEFDCELDRVSSTAVLCALADSQRSARLSRPRRRGTTGSGGCTRCHRWSGCCRRGVPEHLRLPVRLVEVQRAGKPPDECGDAHRRHSRDRRCRRPIRPPRRTTCGADAAASGTDGARPATNPNDVGSLRADRAGHRCHVRAREHDGRRRCADRDQHLDPHRAGHRHDLRVCRPATASARPAAHGRGSSQRAYRPLGTSLDTPPATG